MKNVVFEKIAAYADRSFPMPTRQTKYSAGYDIYLPESVTIPAHSQKMISTGIKAYMQDDEFLGIYPLSMAIKRHLRLVNNEGIVDADYYNNPDNEGHLMIALANDTDKDIVLQAHERIAQGIFIVILRRMMMQARAVRSGGFGSTTSKGGRQMKSMNDLVNACATIGDWGGYKIYEWYKLF